MKCELGIHKAFSKTRQMGDIRLNCLQDQVIRPRLWYFDRSDIIVKTWVVELTRKDH